MSRVGTASTNDLIITQILNTQTNVFDFQRQTASEKQATLYSGLDGQGQRLINLENSRNSLLRFQDNNIQAELRNNVTTTVLESAEDLMKNFRNTLFDLREQPLTETEVTALQEEAFRNLVELEALLNTDVDGRHIFAGGRVLEKPIDLNLTTLEDLQNSFDGELISVPTTRTGNLDEFVIDENPDTGNPNHLTFTRDSGSGVSRITATTAQFSDVVAGTTITISGTDSGLNDGTYEVKTVDSSGMYVEVVTKQFAKNNTPQTVTLTYPDRNDPSITQTLSGVNVTFDRESNQLTVTNGQNISNIQVGKWFTISGSSDNDGTYTVKTNDNTNITIESKRLTDEGGTSTTAIDLSTGAFNLTDSNPDTIAVVPATAGTFDGLEPGDRLQITGTGTQDDGRFIEVGSVSADGTILTLASASGISVPPSSFTAGSLITRPEQFYFDADRVIKSIDTTFNARTIGIDAVNTATFADVGAAGTDTITLANGQTFTDPQGNALPVGTVITVTSTGANNGNTYTITGLSSGNTVATVAEDITGGLAETQTDGTLVSSTSFTFGNDGTNDTLTLGGGTTFTDHDGNALTAGTEITLTGTNAGTYVIQSVDSSTQVTLTSNTPFAAATSLASTLSATGRVTFTANGTSAADTITLNGGTFQDADGNNLEAGSQVTFTGTGGGDDNITYTIASVSTDGTVATLVTSDEVSATATYSSGTSSISEVTGTVTSTSYYDGDTTSLTHRLSDTLSIEDDLNAVHPTFEKAIRAMLLIAQGEVGTAGGLDQNLDRIDDAAFLMNDALDSANVMPEPFGTEETGSMDRLIVEVGFDAVLLNDVTVRNNEILSFLEESIADIENADPLEAITNLLDEQRALEASFSAFTRVRELTLLNFLN